MIRTTGFAVVSVLALAGCNVTAQPGTGVPCSRIGPIEYAYDPAIPETAANEQDTRQTVRDVVRQNAVISAVCAP